jgi:hypothetical protein
LPGTDAARRLSSRDAAALRRVALDYIEGWYEGDPARMARALHPELAKRIVVADRASGRQRLDSMNAETLVERTRVALGSRTPPEKRQKDITILDRFGDAAVVRMEAAEFVDFLEIARIDGEWKIVNVLWEVKPGSELAGKLK